MKISKGRQALSSWLTKKVKNLFRLSVLVYLFFYVSAFFTHTLDIFFEHVTSGQDFFQIPNAAYAFWHGGTLQGELPFGIKPYTSCCSVNPNVYHPLFTLLIGTPLQFFPPWTAFGIWVIGHLVVSALIILFFATKFKKHPYLYLALSLYLLSSYHYYEIQHAQYHFLLIFFTILFIHESATKGDTGKAGFWLFLSLLIKPIGLLWLIPLFLYKRLKTIAFGLGAYLFASLPFLFVQWGKYYFLNLKGVIGTQAPNYNLTSIIYFLNVDSGFFKYLPLLVAFFLVLYQIIRKPPLFFVIFLWIAFQLIFYPLTFHYHYSILAGLIPLGILLNIFSPKRLRLVAIIFLTLPTPIILFRLFWQAPAILTSKQLATSALWSLSWLILFCFQPVESSDNFT